MVDDLTQKKWEWIALEIVRLCGEDMRGIEKPEDLKSPPWEEYVVTSVKRLLEDHDRLWKELYDPIYVAPPATGRIDD